MPVIKYDEIKANKIEMEGAAHILKKVPIGEKEGWDGYTLRTFTIGPGGHSPKHIHDWEHVNYVIQGKGRLMIDDKEQDVNERDVCQTQYRRLKRRPKLNILQPS